MDLGMLISQSAKNLKKNWILVVPAMLTQIVVPLALFVVAVLAIAPLVVAFNMTGDIWGLAQTVAVGGAVLLIAGFLVNTVVTAGWAYMNKRVVVDGGTRLEDFWFGARKYFPRILGGRVLVAVIVVVPIAALVAAFVASIASLNVGPLPPPGEVSSEAIFRLLAPVILGLLGIFVIVGLIELLLYIFLLPWMQALVMDDLGIWASVRRSFGFVRRNFATMIGYVVISGVAWIAASWATSFLWPSIPFLELTQPRMYEDSTRLLGLVLGAGSIVNSLISALLSAFFTLLLFVIYADRRRGSVPSAAAEGAARSS